MDFYAWDHEFSNLGSIGIAKSCGNSSGVSLICGNGDGAILKSSESLILDEEKGELVKAHGKMVEKKVGFLTDEKALAALKNHSEAERRRRERINAHLDTLRGLVPCTDKMDKATLLAEVIRQVKQLKTEAKQASKGLLIPQDADEIKIEKVNDAADDGSLTFRTTFCFKYSHGLLTDLRKVLAAIKVNIIRAEMSTLGDHGKIIFDFKSNANVMAEEVLCSAVHEAITSLVEKMTISQEYSPRTANKRRRYSL